MKLNYDNPPFGMLMPGRNDNVGKYRFGFNGMEKDDEVSGSANSYTAEYWQYDSRLGRRWNTDPVVKPFRSPYLVLGNSPIYYVDPKGDCEDCPKEAKELNTATSQGNVQQGQVWKDVNGSTFEFDKELGWLNTGKNTTDNTKPFELGLEYFSGTGQKEHNFTAGDPMTELLKQHSHIQNTRDHIASKINSIELNRGYTNSYSLEGLAGIPKYIKDYSTLVTFGQTGNLATTYLGSYGLIYKVTEIDLHNNTARVQFNVSNASTLSSLTHPPYFGYTPFWNEYVGDPLDKLVPSSGPLSKTTQNLNWSETIQLK